MRRLDNAHRGSGERKRDRPTRQTWLRAAVGVGVWAAGCLILLGYNLFPGRMSLQVGEASPALIRAPAKGAG